MCGGLFGAVVSGILTLTAGRFKNYYRTTVPVIRSRHETIQIIIEGRIQDEMLRIKQSGFQRVALRWENYAGDTAKNKMAKAHPKQPKVSATNRMAVHSPGCASAHQRYLEMHAK